MSEPKVKKRCVFFLSGYEPIPPERQHERYIRELSRSERTWNIQAKTGPLELSPDGWTGQWRIAAAGPNWSTECDYRSLLWSDMVMADFARPSRVRLPRGIAAFADFILSGSAFHYLMLNWRYGLFFFYPVLILLAFAAASITAGVYAADYLPLPWLLAPLVSIALFAGLTVWPGRFLLLDYMLDDWIFAHEFVHRSRPGFEERLDAFARQLAQVMRDGSFDEVIFAAHSLGCAIKVTVVDRALQLVPDFGKNGERLAMLSTGSSLLKIALHPKGGWMKDAVARVSAHPAIFWVEYQTMADPISFYKVDPLAALHLPATDRPIIKRVHVRDMLEQATYRRFKANFFRLHRQLVMGNDKRYFYDYYMVCCGPHRLETRVLRPDTIVPSFGPDGALLDADSGSAITSSTAASAS